LLVRIDIINIVNVFSLIVNIISNNIRYAQSFISKPCRYDLERVLTKKKTATHTQLHQKSTQRKIKYITIHTDRMNLGNTPNRTNPKPSLSPLRSRRTESSICNRINVSRRKNEPFCINDPHKNAKYLINSEEETLYYCEKCAILLASQGFTVLKIQTTDSIEINPRKEEVDSFLAELDMVMGVLSKKTENINTSVASVTEMFQ